MGQFASSSNYTFLVKVTQQSHTLQAVYKPDKGQVPLWDFPLNTLTQRELAAYLLSELLGWDLVPPTVYRSDAPLGNGTLQLFVAHNPDRHYFAFNANLKSRLRKVALFDVLANNADRKGGHVLVDNNNHIWLIDHGLCFHQDEKLRTVIWDFAGQPIPEVYLKNIRTLILRLKSEQHLRPSFSSLLSREEMKAFSQRIKKLLKSRTFPSPSEVRRSHPWPLI